MRHVAYNSIIRLRYAENMTLHALCKKIKNGF